MFQVNITDHNGTSRTLNRFWKKLWHWIWTSCNMGII